MVSPLIEYSIGITLIANILGIFQAKMSNICFFPLLICWDFLCFFVIYDSKYSLWDLVKRSNFKIIFFFTVCRLSDYFFKKK